MKFQHHLSRFCLNGVLPVILAGSLSVSPASAEEEPEPPFIVVSKMIHYRQIDADTVVMATNGQPGVYGGAYEFFIGLENTGADALASVVFPAGSPFFDDYPGRDFEFREDDNEWLLEYRTDDLFDFDRYFPEGDYSVTLDGITTTLNLSGNAYPNTPVVTIDGNGSWQDGRYVMQKGNVLEIATNVFTDYSTDGLHVLMVELWNDNETVSSHNQISNLELAEELAEEDKYSPEQSATVAVPADSLPPGRYTMEVLFTTAVDSIFDDEPSAVAIYETSTRAEIIVAPLVSYDSWRTTSFPPEAVSDDAVSGPTADFNGDGIPNLLKYAFGIAPQIRARDRLPIVMTTEDGLSITFMRRQFPDLEYRVEISDDLLEWRHGDQDLLEVSVMPYDNYFEVVTMVDANPQVNGEKRFIRLNVDLQ